MITRHDIPDTVKEFTNIAVKEGLIDHFDLIELGSKFETELKSDWGLFIENIINYCSFNTPLDREIHREVSIAADKYFEQGVK